MIMEKEEEEEELFTEWPAEEREQESTEDEDDEKEMETEREKSGLDILRPSVSLANRRASLPCPTQLSAMHLTHLTHLTHLHMTTMAPSPVGMRHRLKDGEARKQGLHSQHDRNQDEENESKLEKWPSAIPNLLHVPEKRRRFRSRNVISLSDADSMCLICHDDLCRRGGTIWELHCSHNFHSEVGDSCFSMNIENCTKKSFWLWYDAIIIMQ
ncbi:uncharacterized protein si:ch211-207l14.1 isoform X1 [Ictalurus furcatus]|uniref:uncharacterized protein si:ch211-207l14.1 isoform X1 n=1 Tax=Ictalurus furcatus TaxID=66913 RepID=UPI0023506C42|nr:uncharacterized protein si:ch211-207l14.1 isoform X1 [Ictalurus furcatus]